MSFEIKLQKNNSEKNVVSKNLTTLTTINAELKHNTSVLEPVLLVTGNLDDLVECNYVTIDIFKRKYFVKNIVSVRNDLVELYLHVDVLGTYANDIRNQTGIIARQENKYNLYLDDGTFMTYQDVQTQTIEFTYGFSGSSYVIGIAGVEQSPPIQG